MRQPIFLIVLLAAVASSSPVDTQLNPQRAREGEHIIVTGVPVDSVNGPVPLRREIRDLQDNYPDQFNLYLLGLQSLQGTDEGSPVSYYELAGIHAMPYRVWQGAEGLPNTVGAYCPHGNTLFFPWHRPYLALFEQVLYDHIQAISQQFSPSLIDKYTTAAADFRIPYWDWARADIGKDVPEILIWPTIQVIGTDGVGKMIENPLYQYRFPSVISQDFGQPWTNYTTTLRYPTSTSPNATSQIDKLLDDYRGTGLSARTTISNGFILAKDFNELSMTYIEQAHGWIHWTIGGVLPLSGHFWPTEYSAFEPVFWLHHANVDRLYDLWSAAHPDKPLTPAAVPGGKGNMWLKPGDTVDANTPLLPFWNSTDTFWTMEAVKDTRVLGYAYPETQVWSYATGEEYRAAVNASIAVLYSAEARAVLTGRTERESGINEDRTGMERLVVGGVYVHWSVQCGAANAGLLGAFALKFFLTDDGTEEEVGAWTIMSSSSHTGAAKRSTSSSTLEPILKGDVGLTEALLARIAAGELTSLDKDAVVPYLRGRLSWRVLSGDGTILAQESLAALTIEVASTKIRIPDDPTQLLEPIGDWTFYPEVTRGKSGGVAG